MGAPAPKANGRGIDNCWYIASWEGKKAWEIDFRDKHRLAANTHNLESR